MSNEVPVMQIEPHIRQYLAENFLFSDNGYELEDEVSFLEEGIVDSTGVLELVAFLEETWSIEVEDEELVPENLDTLGNITRFVQRKSGQEST